MSITQLYIAFFFGIFGFILFLVLWAFEAGNAKQWREIAEELRTNLQKDKMRHREETTKLIMEHCKEMQRLEHRAKTTAWKVYQKGVFSESKRPILEIELKGFSKWWQEQMDAPEEQ